MVERPAEALAAPRAEHRRAEGVERLAVEEADDGVAEVRRQRGDDDSAGQVEEQVAAGNGPTGEILRRLQKL